MQITGTASLATYPAIVSTKPATDTVEACLAAMEESIQLAMGDSYVSMPSALVGTTNVNGGLNAETVHVVESKTVNETPLMPEEEESEMLPVAEMTIVEDITCNGELNEVVGFTELTDIGFIYAVVETERGDRFRVGEGDWKLFYGKAGELELLAAYDRAWLASKRKNSNLVAA